MRHPRSRPRRGSRDPLGLHELDGEVLGAFPQREPPDLRQIVVPLDHGREVVARELTDLARKERRTVWKEDLGLRDAAWIDEHLAGRGMARVVLEREPAAIADLRVAHRDPRGLAAPAAVDQFAAERKHRPDRGDRVRSPFLLEARTEREW